jgi:hypothetical protein
MAQATLKKTHQEVIVKVWPASGDGETTNNIVLANLAAVGQEVDSEADQVVNIAGVTWLGNPAGIITITRGDTIVMTLPCTGANEMDMTGQDLPPDTVNNTEDIEVTFEGVGQVYLKLRKVSGYLNQVENATYGAYDDPTRVGASTTINGSPDYVAP